MITRNELVKYAKYLLDQPTTFVWGTSGQIISNDVIVNAVVKYPKRYDSNLIIKLHNLVGSNVRCFECTGIIKGAICLDNEMTADDMYNLASEKGLIDSLPEIPGVLLHMSGHCGVYIGNGQVIEATYNPKFGFGVVKTNIKDRDWIAWYKCHVIDYK